MNGRTIMTEEAARKAGIEVNRLRQWMADGVIDLGDPYRPQRWRADQVADLRAIASVLTQANQAGLRLGTIAIRDIWVARSMGFGWRVTLDSGKAKPCADA
jgi:hypothetical protein